MSTAAPEQPTAPGAAPAELPHSGREFLQRIRQGEMGSVRVIILLAVIWTIFQVQESRFLSAVNLTNLVLQITAVGLISVGVVLVLLLGEIDLSVGAVSGLCASIMAVLNVKHGWAPIPAVLAGIAAGAAIGLFQGFVSTRFGIPTFVVTLAGLLGWQGAQLKVLGETGTVNLSPGFITDLTGKFLSHGAGWIVGIVAVAAFAALAVLGRQRRTAAGLTAPSPALLGVRIAAVAIATLVAIYVVNQDRGVPVAALILVGFVAGIDFITRRTRFGRHIFAVGGNERAARISGVRVNMVKMFVYMFSGFCAAIVGLIISSELMASHPATGESFELNAIAAAVLGGTSMSGGRGTIGGTIVGAFVIGILSDGLVMMGVSSFWQMVIKGLVIIVAVVVDQAQRRLQQRVTLMQMAKAG